MVAELRAMPPKIVYQERKVEIIQEVPSRIGDKVDRLMDMYKANYDNLAKRLAQDMLYYYRLYRKFERLANIQSRI